MSAPLKHLYEFGEFRLDPKERILLRGDQPVELTPKGFELLSLLVENHGRLLGKNELMEKIWAGSFVEDSNLTFNIRQLRKALDDDAHNPKYIKTVRQHGYRFIADVKEIPVELKLYQANQPEENNESGEINQPRSEAGASIVSPPAEIAFTEKPTVLPTRKKSHAPIFLGIGGLLLAAIFIGLWYTRSKSFAPYAPILSAPFSSEKLSTTGKVTVAVLSPDGKNVIYTNGTGAEKQSVWLRQLETGNSVEIIPPSDEQYFGLAISPDEKTLYFARGVRLSGDPESIYRVSIFGGIPQKILSGTELGWMSISPDGNQISFVRCPQQKEEFCSLYIADAADGKNERKIVSRSHPFRIGGNRFAPDGKSIAFATGQSVTSSNEFELKEVELESGAERELTNEKFYDIKNVVWLPDKSGLLITASRFPNKNFRIWQVSAATREASPLTNDSESYAVLNMNKDATAMVSTQFKENFRIRLIPLENLSDISVLTNASSASFAPDGKIYFSSMMSGNDEIWSINPDGSGQRQLTNNPADEFAPIVSPDNKSVFFVSNKSGSGQLWRMNTDGSNQTQMTQTDGGAPVFVSPDGEWVYYRHISASMLWRISTKTGEQQLVLNKAKPRFAFSPDGKQVAFSERQGDERILTIVSLADGQTVKTFHLADKKLILMHIAWMPDGKNLAYITANPGFVNKVLWFQQLDEETPRQIRALGDEEITEGYGLSVSPDGKTFAVIQGGWLHDAVLLKGLR
jgi:Tol biopolymer transport system component/DNA-binding winged helix-turn-helix (wHTH) protein